jgi:hypothetical protein
MAEKEPAYVAKFKEADPLITRIGIERSILRAWQDEWSKKKSPYGYTFTYHFCQYLKRVCPNTDLHAFTVRLIKGFEKTAFIKNRKIMNMIGSKNSGKTDFCATFALAMLSIWPEYTTVYVAAPYMSAADSTVWGRIQTRMKQMKKANPKMWKGVYEYKAKNRIVFEKHAETGFCELRTLDKIGKLQGTKSYDADKGWLLLFCDEIALFPTRALLDLLDNLTGNDNFFCFTGCNFKNTEGLEGDLCRPYKREYSELDLDADQEWDSAYKSYTIRLDGHESPNIVAGKVLYKYLLREDQRMDAEEIHGKMGPKYLEQIRSFPNNSMSDFFVTSREKIRAGGGWDDFVFDKGQATRVAFCDPGFGGDPCKIGVFEFSNARVQDSEGEFHTVPLFMPLAIMETIKVVTTKIADEDWIKRLHHQSDGAMFLREGQEITMENQIAVQAGEFLQKWGVSRNNFGFDGSMRAGIVQEMISVLGSSIAAVDFGGKPTDRIGDLTGKKMANELYFNFVSEMYFNFAKLVQAGQFRNANLIPAGIAQICRRQWKWRGNLKQVEPKDEYKKANQGRSPDDADTLVGALEMALRKGFMETRRNRPSGINGASKIANMINQSPRFRKKTAQKLHS